ncbi:AraC family transcriptional regulator [Methylobrevis albus]|uniref:Helix-turn-helix transcriptional regulator n=1 Tax=Methylobrevis albus TaxID=2793297 RepID=A0A931MWG2_9HYPH|nr:AraC family transcriptional regulator [Methylobrevis albus]MBH0236918.1 helix-turn-helix transcriptional regulator [Methylobrevis albus]
MEHQRLFDGSARARCPVSVSTRHSKIGIFRHQVGSSVETVASAPAQDAHLVVMQLRDLPPHDFWADDKRIRMPFTGAGSLGILDLRRESSARFVHPLDSLHVHLPREALDDIAEDAGARPVDDLVVRDGWEPADSLIRGLQPILFEAVRAPENAAPTVVDHLVLAVAAHVAATYGNMRPALQRRSALAPWQLRRAQEMLADNLDKELSLLDIAEACGLSLSYFTRAFKASTGTTPHGWLQTCRVDKARGLLVSGDLPLAEIALACGFADQSHFTRIFRRQTGMGPGAWRRERAVGRSLVSTGSPGAVSPEAP